jgi:putative copper resistance protein D
LISGLAAAMMMILLVWLHVLAAVSWIGGSIFLSVVLVPVLRREPFASQKALLFRTTALRFRVVVWGAIATLLLTGPLLLHQRGIPIADPAGWPMVLSVKLGLVAILLLFTATHDLFIGPRVGRILQIPMEGRTRLDHTLVIWSPWIARFSLVLTLAVLLAAVVLVRT